MKIKNIQAAVSFFVFVGFARAEVLNIVAPKIQIEVRDPAVFKTFKNPFQINYETQEKETLKAYKGKASQEKMKLLIFDLKDLIDEKAGPIGDSKRVSDLSKEQRDEIALLGDLREQLALNWLENESLAVLKQHPNKDFGFESLNKRLLEEFFFNVEEKTLRSFFCHKESRLKVSDCQAVSDPIKK